MEEKNNKEDVFKVSSDSNHGFEKVNPKENNYKKVNNYYAGKKKSNIGRGFFLPFISGILGTTLMLGICYNVPSIKNKLLNSETKQDETKTPSVISTTTGSVNNLVDVTDYSSTSIAVAEKVLPSVVGIEVELSVSVPSFYGTSQGISKTSGSGVIISKDGYILTNNHIIDSSSSSYYQVSAANKVSVYLYGKEDPYEAEIIGSDNITDLAILKIEADDLVPAELGDSSAVKVGEFAMAIGNPLNMPNTVTSGIISAKDREITDTDGTNYTLIQTDAAINSGNSGGALVNADGKVIGINTLKLYGNGIEGMGFAIPINSTIDIIDQLITYNKVKRPYLGISGSDITEEYSKSYNVPVGVCIRNIEEDGPAKLSELKIGDIITKYNDTEIKSMTELNTIKNKSNIGDKVTLTIYRDGKTIEVEVTLAEQP